MQSITYHQNNTKINYEMGSKIVDSLKKEQDLGVIISSVLKVAKQYRKILGTANRLLGMIYRTFT